MRRPQHPIVRSAHWPELRTTSGHPEGVIQLVKPAICSIIPFHRFASV